MNKQELFNSPFIYHVTSDIPQDKKVENKPIYHYTSSEAFLSIVAEKQIRFTDVRYMNDRSETTYVVQRILSFVEENRENFPQFASTVYKLLEENNIDDIKENNLIEIRYYNLPYHPYAESRHFLFCTCARPDLLNMWNYYIKNGNYQGYSIGFNLYNFLKTFDTEHTKILNSFSVYHGKVLYKEEEQFSLIRPLADEIEKMLTKDYKKKLKHALFSIRNFIETKGLFFKSNQFASEEEYRIAICILEKNIPHNSFEANKYAGPNNREMVQGFCINRGMVVPYLNVVLPPDAVSKITISPITEYDITKSSTKELLKVMGYPKVPIYQSKIPIRY